MFVIVLDDMSAARAGMSLTDYVYLQRGPATRVVRRRRSRRSKRRRRKRGPTHCGTPSVVAVGPP